MTISATRLVHVLGLVGVLYCGLAQPAPIEDVVNLSADTFGCGGSHFLRARASQQRRRASAVSNPNPEISVALDRVGFEKLIGSAPFDYASDSLATSVKSGRGLYKTAQSNRFGILTEELTSWERPTQNTSNGGSWIAGGDSAFSELCARYSTEKK